MIQTMECGEARISLGVYVLGAIDPAERALVDAHLVTCRDCRDELAGLAGLPALLARVSAEEAIALAEDGLAEQPALSLAAAGAPDADADARDDDSGRKPPRPGADATEQPQGTRGGYSPEGTSELLGTVLDLTAARRRRRNWRNVGLSAAAAVIIAAAAFAGAHQAASPSNTSTASQSGSLYYGNPVGSWKTDQGETAGMYATVMYRQMGWGTQLAAKVVGVPVGTPCQLIVVGTDGTKTVVGGWTTDTAEGSVYYPASAPVSPQAVREFQVTVAGHKTITVAS